MIEKLFDIRNSVDFYLRNKFSFSRKNFVFKNECKDKMFSSKEEQDIEKELFEKKILTK